MVLERMRSTVRADEAKNHEVIVKWRAKTHQQNKDISVWQTAGSRAENSETKISSEWAEACLRKGIAAGCYRNGRDGLFEKHHANEASEQGSKYLYTCNRL